jgi:hypothetical protein
MLRPWLIIPDSGTDGFNDAMLEIIPVTEPSGRFRYRIGAALGQNPQRRWIEDGEEMVLEPGCITILRHGRELGYFPMNAYLWWREKVFHADFWRQYLAVKSFPQPGSVAQAAPASKPKGHSLESLRLKKNLSARLREEGIKPARFAGYAIASLQTAEQPQLEILLQKGQTSIRLFIKEAAGAQRPYAAAGGYAVYYNQTTPLDSPEKRTAVKEFARFLTAISDEPQGIGS